MLYRNSNDRCEMCLFSEPGLGVRLYLGGGFAACDSGAVGNGRCPCVRLPGGHCVFALNAVLAKSVRVDSGDLSWALLGLGVSGLDGSSPAATAWRSQSVGSEDPNANGYWSRSGDLCFALIFSAWGSFQPRVPENSN